MVQKGKIGVLLVNLGTPDAPDRSSVYRYLKEFLLDKRVIDYPWLQRQLLVRALILPFRSGQSAKLYQKLWTAEGSPLKFYGERLAKGVQEALGEDYIVALAMRYQNPSLASVVEQLLEQQVSEIIVLPLFPQYASASTGSVVEEVMRLLSKKEAIPTVRFINSFYDNEGMIDVFAKNAKTFDLETYDHVLFSFHGLPERQLKKADNTGQHCLQEKDCCQQINSKNQFCYSAHCYATARAIVAKLGLSLNKYTVCFQSRLGKDEWRKPYTTIALEERLTLGDKKLLVFCPAFVADCLETTIEVLHEYREDFIAGGGEQLDLVPSLNDDPDWVKAVAKMVVGD